MSVKVMSLVWDTDFSSTEKLVLLKLADCGNDQGTSIYPSVTLIARQTGLSTRTVRYTIKSLCANNVLKLINKAGEKYKTNSYAIDLKELKENRGEFNSGVQEIQEPPETVAGGGGTSCTQTIIEPLKKRKEVYNKKAVAERMALLYGECLGEWLPKVVKISEARKNRLFTIFKNDFEEKYENWEAYLYYVSQCPWLIGENPNGWRANLDWIIKPQNMNKILEGNYEKRTGNNTGKETAIDSMYNGFKQAIDKAGI